MTTDAAVQYTEKKRMGIALRRFVTGAAPCYRHMDYFGCDAEFLRAFFEYQLDDLTDLSDLGKKWHIGHVLSPLNFNHEDDQQVRLCWNWVNLRPVKISKNNYDFSYAQAVEVYSSLRKCFPEHEVLGVLLDMARKLHEWSKPPVVKWEFFMAENKYEEEDELGI